MSNMDWEEFARKALKLNQSRTRQEELDSFRNSAETAWACDCVHPEDVSFHEGMIVNQPLKLQVWAAEMIKKCLFIKEYIRMIDYITEGQGIIPTRWNDRSRRLRDGVVRIKNYTPDDVVNWLHENYHE